MPDKSETSEQTIDPITVEVIGNAIASIADEMGETLVRASYSTNIKERRDCSTVLFDATGRTLYQAEHIPASRTHREMPETMFCHNQTGLDRPG